MIRFGDIWNNDPFFLSTYPKSVTMKRALPKFCPSVDVVEKETVYEINAEVPGLSAGDLQVDLHKGVLTISGTKKGEIKEIQGDKEEVSTTKKVHRAERYFGSFTRSFTLPEDADGDKGVTAHLENGVLHLSIAKKKPEEKLHKISIPIQTIAHSNL